jgi:GAF domain-containing protein
MSANLRTADAAVDSDEPRLRSAALRALAVLDTPSALGFDALARLAAHACAVQVAVIELLDGERAWFKAVHGIDAAALREGRSSFFRATALSEPVLEVTDTQLDPRFADSPVLDGALHMRYGAGAAIRFEGAAIGTLCVFNPVPHRGSPASLRALEDLAAVATAMLRARIEAFQLYSETR